MVEPVKHFCREMDDVQNEESVILRFASLMPSKDVQQPCTGRSWHVDLNRFPTHQDGLGALRFLEWLLCDGKYKPVAWVDTGNPDSPDGKTA
jgi:hypothetical protein